MNIKLLIVMFLGYAATSSEAYAFTWGVCGHYGHSALWNDPETQFYTMEKYGLKTYRFDVILADDVPNAVEDLQKLVKIAEIHGITLHPVLQLPFTWGNNVTDGGKYPNSEYGLEQQGYNRVYPFVLKFAHKIHDWELQNELNLLPDIKKEVGINVSDYDTAKAKQWAALLRGMSRAIRDVEKQTKEKLRVVVNTTYASFGFIPFLEQNGVSIDKVAYHYYYDVETSPYRIYIPNGTIDLFAELKKLGKPIIINEFNSAEIYDPKNKNIPYNDDKALLGLKKHIEYIHKQKTANIEGVEYYELYDEPQKDIAESNFGIMKDAKNSKIQMLLAAVYSCGNISQNEKELLISSRLFDTQELKDKLNLCKQ